MLKPWTTNLADTFTGSIRPAREKFWRKGTLVYPGTALIFFELQIWQVHSQGPSEQKPLKNLGEKGAWAYPETAKKISVPPIISGMGKPTNSKFCTLILSIDRNKIPLQISGNL